MTFSGLTSFFGGIFFRLDANLTELVVKKTVQLRAANNEVVERGAGPAA